MYLVSLAGNKTYELSSNYPINTLSKQLFNS